MAAKILKLLCVFFSVVTVLLCGCAPKEASATEPAAAFRADFSADYRGLRLAGELTHTRQGVCTLRLTSPETLEGLQLRFQDNTVALRRGDAAATADEPYLPAESFPEELFVALQAASKGEYAAQDDVTLALSLPHGDGLLTLDSNGLPLVLRLPDGSGVTFSHTEPLD